jgi:hypothetical protein
MKPPQTSPDHSSIGVNATIARARSAQRPRSKVIFALLDVALNSSPLCRPRAMAQQQISVHRAQLRQNLHPRERPQAAFHHTQRRAQARVSEMQQAIQPQGRNGTPPPCASPQRRLRELTNSLLLSSDKGSCREAEMGWAKLKCANCGGMFEKTFQLEQHSGLSSRGTVKRVFRC